MTSISPRPDAAPAGDRLSRAVSNTVRGSLGNLVEWYDVYVYTVFATYFESQFFGGDQPNATLYTLAIFAVTFVMRPVGSWYFGRFADRRGRRPALVVSISMMALASLVIAVTPTHAQIGNLAIVILVLCRLVQGFATGGEYGTSATYMSEAAPRGRRGFLSSFQYVTLVGGQVVAQLVLLLEQAVMSEEALHSYGWRIAFGIGAISALVVLWLRSSMDESLATEGRSQRLAGRAGSLHELLTVYWRPLFICFMITLGGTVAFYTYSVNGPAMVTSAYKGHGSTSTWINLLALVVLMLLQPVGGLISDRIGRKPLLVFFGVGAVLWTAVLISTLPTVTKPLATFGMLLVSYVILTGYTSINAVVKAELFPAHVRALGVGIGYAIANSIFGGTSPLIYQAAKQAHQVPLFIAYVTVAVALSLIVYAFVLKNRAPTQLDLDT